MRLNILRVKDKATIEAYIYFDKKTIEAFVFLS